MMANFSSSLKWWCPSTDGVANNLFKIISSLNNWNPFGIGLQLDAIKHHVASFQRLLVQKLKIESIKSPFESSKRINHYSSLGNGALLGRSISSGRIALAWLVLCPLSVIIILQAIAIAPTQAAGRMVRLCIASVDPIKLSSQCVMCNRRDFPLTVIDCTGIGRVTDLIANPLSVRQATCLIYNCRRQVPDVKPEPYHGSVSQAANYRTNGSNYPIVASGSQLYEMMPPSGIVGANYASMLAQGLGAPSSQATYPNQLQASPYMSRYGTGYRTSSGNPLTPLSSLTHRGLVAGANMIPDRGQQALPYALIQAPSTFPFGSRKYKAALVPLFR